MYASHLVTVLCIAFLIDYTKSNGCIEPGSNLICSGRGTCQIRGKSEYSAGFCICDKRERPDEVYAGSYCQCDNFTCLRYEGRLCSGLENGYCYCGKCLCVAGHTGAACQYPPTVVSEANEPSCLEGVFGRHCLPMIDEENVNDTLKVLVSILAKQ